jgi:putative ABC transport system permease protein
VRSAPSLPGRVHAGGRFGFVLGAIAAMVLAQAIRTFIYVSPTDLVTFGAIAMTMAAATLLASYLPSRRATRIDPVVALRHDQDHSNRYAS